MTEFELTSIIQEVNAHTQCSMVMCQPLVLPSLWRRTIFLVRRGIRFAGRFVYCIRLGC